MHTILKIIFVAIIVAALGIVMLFAQAVKTHSVATANYAGRTCTVLKHFVYVIKDDGGDHVEALYHSGIITSTPKALLSNCGESE